jgi:hypothetical protein
VAFQAEAIVTNQFSKLAEELVKRTKKESA